jgi:CubicO group peptidase (beta-lactamase class C family)
MTLSDPDEVLVDGHVADGFEAVREAFVESLRHRGELGASFAVTRDGALVVDLWGGVADADTRRPWRQDTLQVIFSGTKGLVALCLLMLIDRGELDMEAPVARYWPEFATNGKAGIRVLDVVSHQARLPGLRVPLSDDAEILDDRRMAALLAVQATESDPRAAFTYHALTYGWLCGELVRRVDGRSVGRFFAEEVADPLGLEIWIGLPPELEPRVSTLAYSPQWGRRRPWGPDEIARDEFLNRVLNNPPLFPPGRIPWNAAAWHRAEIASAGGIGTARALARLYGCLALGGELDGVRLLRTGTLERGRRALSQRWDPVVLAHQAFAFGFEIQTDLLPLGPAADAFGHRGAGGSIHCAWPSLRAGVSYAMNLMRDDPDGDPRGEALLDAAHAALVGRNGVA